MKLLRTLTLSLAIFSIVNAGVAAPPPDFETQMVLPAISQPMGMVFLPDERMLIIRKSGQILIADPSAPTPVPSATYMALSNINSAQERGLIDITLDPEFESNGWFYLYYTPGTPQRARISRFTHQENTGGLTSTGNLSSEVVLWQDNDGYISCCHFGGGLDFGPDGRLYLTTGDKFDGLIAQDLMRAGGKIIRINNDGSIPEDNFGLVQDGPGGIIDSIWAYGLRNPFRARWDLLTDRFFVAEVGGNTQTIAWEDVHLGRADVNFGWPLCEGPCDNPSFPGCSCGIHDDPAFTYPHSGSGASLTGGVVYRGGAFPADPYFGAYFYGDFSRTWIRYLTFDPFDPTVVTGDFEFEPSAGPVIAIEEGPDGALYWLTIAGNAANQGEGDLRRFVFVGDQTPTITLAEATPTSGTAPLQVDFSGAATDDFGPLTYLWNFGDGNEAFGANVSHSYLLNGVFSATLHVSDGTNQTTSQPILISVGNPPEVDIPTPSESPPTLFQFGDTVTFVGTATDVEDGPLPASAFEWSCDFVRPSTRHPAFGPTSGVTSIDFEIPIQGQGFSGPVFYECRLTVTDSDGLSSSALRRIYPDKVDLTFESEPPGMTLFFDGLTRTAPFVEDTLINFDHIITAPETQCLGGTEYAFVEWSDGGAAQHTITVPSTDDTLTATYEAVAVCEPPTSGLVMRLIGDEGVTLDAQDRVVLWEDQTASGNDVSPPVGFQPPSLTESGLSGSSFVSFNGVDDALGRTGTLGLPTGQGNRSIFMVVRYRSNGWGGFVYGVPTCNRAFGLAVSGSSPTTGNLAAQGWCSANDFPTSVLGNGAGWITQGLVYSDSVLTQYANGDEIASESHIFDTSNNRLRIGVELNNDRRIAMDLAEVLVYNRPVTSSERQQIENYLSARYFDGMGINMPPTASFDNANVALVGGSTVINVLGNDSDADGTLDPATVSVVTPPNNGSLSAPDPATGAITYTHDGSSAITDHFEYTVEDDGGAVSNEATVFITVGPPLCPLPASGLVLQLGTNEGLGLSGNRVQAWLDQSGNGNDFTAEGAPTLIPGELNGRDIIRFDGNDALLRIGNLAGFPSGSSDRTVFSVVRYVQPFGVTAGFAFGTGSSNKAFGLVATPGGNLAVQGWGVTNDFDSGIKGTNAGWLTQSAVLEGSLLRHFRDGQLIDTDPHVFDTVLGRAVIAQEIAELGSSAMDASAFLVYNRALSEGERQQVESYLQERYFGVPCTVTNTPPVAEPDSAAVNVGQAVTIDVLENDSDIDGVLNPATIVVVDPPTNGTIVWIDPMSGWVVYQHDGGATSSDSFTYTVEDEVGGVSNIATVSVTVTRPACSDGFDNDGDGSIDFDGGVSLDLDENGFVDAEFNPGTPAVTGPDPGCNGNPMRIVETPASCGLGFELALLLPLLAAWRKRRMSR